MDVCVAERENQMELTNTGGTCPTTMARLEISTIDPGANATRSSALELLPGGRRCFEHESYPAALLSRVEKTRLRNRCCEPNKIRFGACAFVMMIAATVSCVWFLLTASRGDQTPDPLFFDGRRAAFQVKRWLLESPKYVYSDVDDTMKSSGGHWPAGIDTNGEKNEIYPGMVSLYLQLSMGPGKQPAQIPSVVPLSARPASAKGMRATGLQNMLKIGKDDPLAKEFASKAPAWAPTWGLDVDEAQYGNWKTINQFIGFGSPEWPKLGAAKYRQWLNHELTNGASSGDSQRHPKATVFLGDNGQGDLYAAMSMAATAEGHGPLFTGALIHHVQAYPLGWTGLAPGPGEERDKRRYGKGSRAPLEHLGISLFSQYGHAACLALTRGFITVGQYVEVMRSIQDECADKWDSSACRVVKVEFEMPHASRDSIRSQILPDGYWRCTISHGSWFPGAVVLDPGNFFNNRGKWVVGARCLDLDKEFIDELLRARRRLGAHLDFPLTDKELFDIHVPPLVAHALRDGLYCATCCRHGRHPSDGCYKDGCDAAPALQDLGVRLVRERGEHAHDGLLGREDECSKPSFTSRGRSPRLCEIVLPTLAGHMHLR